MQNRTFNAALLALLVAQAVWGAEVETHDFDVTYGERVLPIKVYAPADVKNAPLILYSHGLGGSRDTKSYLLRHWAEAGFVCVSVQHPGSDSDVWKQARQGQRVAAMKRAASAEQFLIRTKDIPAALDQLQKWNTDPQHGLHGRIDFKRVGMSGHSFGAVTSQVMMGAKYRGLKNTGDDRFKAFLLMSPSPAVGYSAEAAFGRVTHPVLCMTGTADTSPIRPNIGHKDRAAVYHALPHGNKYLYVFDGGKHDLFSGPTRLKRQFLPEHKFIQDITLLFWQSHLLDDAPARQKLRDKQPRPGDEWILSIR